MTKPCFVPILFDVGNAPVVIVGGGQAALAKLQGLVAFSPRIRLVAPEILPQVETLLNQFEHHEVFRRVWQPSDFDGASLAYIFTNDMSVNLEAADEAYRRGLPANVAKSFGQGGFLSPACVRYKDWIIAVSSLGNSPKQAVKLRDELSEILPNWVDQNPHKEHLGVHAPDDRS